MRSPEQHIESDAPVLEGDSAALPASEGTIGLAPDYLTRHRRIPSLDGLRGLSILAVVVTHAFSHFSHGARHQNDLQSYFSRLGDYGVNVFFVISGFLITNLLLKNRARHGSVVLSAFYKRRAYRILPVSLLYIAVIAGFAHPPKRQVLYATVFLTSFFFSKTYIGLQQLWSLSVEEQFYLLWPSVFLLSPRLTKRMAWCVVFFCPLLRVALRWSGHSNFWHAGPPIADTLAAGCLLALYRKETFSIAQRWFMSTPAFVGVGMVSIVLFFFSRGGYLTCVFWFAVPALIALLVAISIERHDRFLNKGPLVWLGILSFSLYLWQQPFLVFDGPFNNPVARLSAILLTAYASYFFVEKPVLRYANRRTADHSVNTRTTVGFAA